MNLDLTFSNNENNEIVDKFVKEYTQWHETGNSPEIGSLDVNYTLELQKKRLENYNVKKDINFDSKDSSFKNALKCFTVRDKGDYKSDLACKDYKVTETYYINNKKSKVKKSSQNLYTTITRLVNQQANGAISCPNCGAVSSIRELLTGCKSCGTRFIIDDLFPKITNFYHTKNESNTLQKMMKPILAAFMVLTIGIYLIFSLGQLDFNGSFPIEDVLGLIIGTVFVAFLGFMLWGFFMLGWLILGAIFSIPAMSAHIGAKTKLPNLMRKIDPDFSYEFFIGKVINLMKLMIFSDDYTNLAIYDGKPMQNKFKDIVDVRYNGTVRYNSFKSDGNYCYVDITVYTTVAKASGTAIKTKNQGFRVVVCKNIHAMNDSGFSIKKVSCKSCGGSFDATREHNCPYCGNAYHLANDDWVVMDFKKVN